MPKQTPWPQQLIAACKTPQPLQALPWPAGPLNILITAPHPDDFDAIAVTLRWLTGQGHQLQLCVLSGGSKGVQDGYNNLTDWDAKAKVREQEQLNSCQAFGLNPTQVRFLRLPEAEDGELSDSPANQQAIQQIVTDQRYDMVMLPYGNDTNSAHQRTYAMVKAAVQHCSQPMLSCCNKDAKTLNFQLHSYMLFNQETAEWKARLLRCHDSQHSRNLNLRGHGFDDRILQFNQETAAILATDRDSTTDTESRLYAEAFHLEFWN